MINECKCGDILSEDALKCPTCGAANTHFTRPSGPPSLPFVIVSGLLAGAARRWFDLPWYEAAVIAGIGVAAVEVIRKMAATK